MQKYLKCLDPSPEDGTFDKLCTSDHGNISLISFSQYFSMNFSSLPPLHTGQAELWYPEERPGSKRERSNWTSWTPNDFWMSLGYVRDDYGMTL